MTKIHSYLKELPRSVYLLTFILASIFLTGILIAVSTFFGAWGAARLFETPFCLSNKCVEYFINATSQSFVIAKATIDVCVAVATVGGIFVALQSYFTSSKNSALTNHIEHLKIFSEYVDSEIKKRSRMSAELVDCLLLYEKIFHKSRNGCTSVSPDFIEFVKGINLIMEASNAMCTKGAIGGFNYNNHQRQVKEHLSCAGITIFMSPRNDYFEMEEQVFSLIHRISQSFCPPMSVPPIIKRSYH